MQGTRAQEQRQPSWWDKANYGIRLIFRISVGAVRGTLWELSERFGIESKAKQVGAGR